MRADILLNMYIWNLRTQGGPVTRVEYLSTNLLNPTIAFFHVKNVWKVWSFSELHKIN